MKAVSDCSDDWAEGHLKKTEWIHVVHVIWGFFCKRWQLCETITSGALCYGPNCAVTSTTSRVHVSLIVPGLYRRAVWICSIYGVHLQLVKVSLSREGKSSATAPSLKVPHCLTVYLRLRSTSSFILPPVLFTARWVFSWKKWNEVQRHRETVDVNKYLIFFNRNTLSTVL